MQCLEILLFGHGQQVQVLRRSGLQPTHLSLMLLRYLICTFTYDRQAGRAELIGNVTVHNVTAK